MNTVIFYELVVTVCFRNINYNSVFTQFVQCFALYRYHLTISVVVEGEGGEGGWSG
jgi:hypothetical protein